MYSIQASATKRLARGLLTQIAATCLNCSAIHTLNVRAWLPIGRLDCCANQILKCVGELSYQCNDRDLDTRLACMWAAGVKPIKNLCACTVSATIMVTQMC